MKKTNRNGDDLSVLLGKRIRQIRLDKKLKIVDVAKATGLTVSMISQVERAIISPSIETLRKVGEALDVPVKVFFQEANDQQARRGEEGLRDCKNIVYPNQNPVVRENERKILSPSKGINYYLLNPNLNGPIEFIYNVYQPGSGAGEKLYSHLGSECGLILEGQLQVQIRDKTYLLKKGDSITFNSTEPHSIRNLADKVCRCIWVNVPPWF